MLASKATLAEHLMAVEQQRMTVLHMQGHNGRRVLQYFPSDPPGCVWKMSTSWPHGKKLQRLGQWSMAAAWPLVVQLHASWDGEAPWSGAHGAVAMGQKAVQPQPRAAALGCAAHHHPGTAWWNRGPGPGLADLGVHGWAAFHGSLGGCRGHLDLLHGLHGVALLGVDFLHGLHGLELLLGLLHGLHRLL